MNEITLKWNQVYTKALVYQLVQHKHTNVCCQFITTDSADNLKRGVFTLQNIENNFALEISPENSETMALLGQDPVKCIIIVGSKFLQKVMNFKYLGCEIFL